MQEKEEYIRRYSADLLKDKSKEELIEIIELLQDEASMLDFLLREYEAAQTSLGAALEEHLADAIKQKKRTSPMGL